MSLDTVWGMLLTVGLCHTPLLQKEGKLLFLLSLAPCRPIHAKQYIQSAGVNAGESGGHNCHRKSILRDLDFLSYVQLIYNSAMHCSVL